MAKQIQGLYTVVADITELVGGYTFTGANRNASISGPITNDLNFKCVSSAVDYHNDIYFIYENDIKIKRGRIITPLAPGLRAGEGGPACRLLLDAHNADIDHANLNSSMFLRFEKFNEWTDFNFVLKPYAGKVAPNNDKTCTLRINYTYSSMCVDDYNILNDYVGQTFNAALEMEIDTAGVVLQYTGGEI